MDMRPGPACADGHRSMIRSTHERRSLPPEREARTTRIEPVAVGVLAFLGVADVDISQVRHGADGPSDGPQNVTCYGIHVDTTWHNVKEEGYGIMGIARIGETDQRGNTKGRLRLVTAHTSSGHASGHSSRSACDGGCQFRADVKFAFRAFALMQLPAPPGCGRSPDGSVRRATTRPVTDCPGAPSTIGSSGTSLAMMQGRPARRRG